MDDISVLICDDSALMRNLIGRIVDETEGMKVVARAENGLDLIEKLKTVQPDVILLDIQMPQMDGLGFLRHKKEAKIDIPVIILSSVATEGAAVTMQCLDLGASDFITKPGGTSVSLKIGDVTKEIIEYIASYGGSYATKKGKSVHEAEFFSHQIKLKQAERFVIQKKGEESAKSAEISHAEANAMPFFNQIAKKKEPVVIVPEKECGKVQVIALGISTGGPNALRELFKNIDPNVKQPILVVQHMPAGFTKEFAASLNNLCPLTVTEARDGEPLMPGHVYIAPGNYHIYVEHRPLGNLVRLSQEPQRNGHRPSADVLFESVAKIYQNNALGIIMTGMGRDGDPGLAEMRNKGAWTLGQDQASSIVYGMPKVAFELGGVQKQVPLSQMAGELSKIAIENQ